MGSEVSKIQAVKLSDAQWSAIECSGVLEPPYNSPEEEILRLSIQEPGRRLIVSVTTREAIASALCELSNSEDAAAQAKDEMGKLAGRAARALATLMLKVNRLEFPAA